MTDTTVISDPSTPNVSRRCIRGYGMGPCGRRSCSICAVRRRKDWRWVFQQNLGSLGDVNVLMTSVTGPGDETLPFDPSLCRVMGDHVHSGKIGCRVNYQKVLEWRSTLESRWSKLTDAARIRTKRALGGSGLLMIAGAWELQARGVPHVHVVVADSDRGRYFINSLGELASSYGFGFVDTKVEPRHVMVAAVYLSKYMTKYGEDETRISELLPSREYWVSREVSQNTGATLRICRFVRKWWAYQNGFIPYAAVAFKWTEKEHEFVKKFYSGPEMATLESELGVSVIV